MVCAESEWEVPTRRRLLQLIDRLEYVVGSDAIVNPVQPARGDVALLINQIGAGDAVIVDHVKTIVVGHDVLEFHFFSQRLCPLGGALAMYGQNQGVGLIEGIDLVLQLTELLDARRSPVGSGDDEDDILFPFELLQIERLTGGGLDLE